MKKQKIIILGAGITGLSVAYYLSKDKKFDITIIEKNDFIGGSARSFEYKDFILDYGPHKLYTELPGIMEEIAKICPLLKIKKKNSIYLKGHFFDFPLKLSQIATKIPSTAANAGIDILLKPFTRKPDRSYENFLINRFGKTLYNLSFKGYASKVWGSNPQDLDMELARRRVAVSSIFELIKSVLFKDTKKISAEYFYYPEKGMKQLFDKIEDHLIRSGVKILLSKNIEEININNQSIKYLFINKKKIKADFIISTIPLDSLQSLIYPKISSKPELNYQDLNVIYFILNKKRALKDCWIFFPESRFIFQRVSEQKAFSLNTCPKDKTAVMVETTKPIDNRLIREIIKQAESIGLFKQEEVVEYFFKTIKKAYPVYKKGFSLKLKVILDYFDSLKNFYTLGRQGLFNYNNMDQCWDMGIKVADQIIKNKSKQDWTKTKSYFDNYRIVD